MENESLLSGRTQIWLKSIGFTSESIVNIYVDNNLLTTLYPDDNGFYSFYLDTSKYTKSQHKLSAVIKGNDKSIESVRYITIKSSVNSIVKITKQPEGVTVKEGEKATVRVEATGENLTYQWYSKEASSSKFYLTNSFTSNSYSVIMTEARDGRQIYCVITDGDGNKVTTDTVTIAMKPSLSIKKQPESVTVKEGEKATVRIESTGENLTYQWYSKEASSSKFYLTNSFTSNSYSVIMTKARNGRQIYCVITDGDGNKVTTDTVTIAMKPSLSITKQPSNVTVSEGETAKVTFTTSGTDLTYEWYYKDANSSKFYKTTSFKSNTYSVIMNETRAGRQVYCVVTDGSGNKVTTNTVTLEMKPSLVITVVRQINRCPKLQIKPDFWESAIA